MPPTANLVNRNFPPINSPLPGNSKTTIFQGDGQTHACTVTGRLQALSASSIVERLASAVQGRGHLSPANPKPKSLRRIDGLAIRAISRSRNRIANTS